MNTYAFSPQKLLRTYWGPRFGSVVGETVFPPRAPFFFCLAGEPPRFPPCPFPLVHGPEVAP